MSSEAGQGCPFDHVLALVGSLRVVGIEEITRLIRLILHHDLIRVMGVMRIG